MRLAIITDPDSPRMRSLLDGFLPGSRMVYQLDPVLLAARWRGLRWFHTDPTQAFRPADAAILHVDRSVTPEACLELAARYPVTLNGNVADIRKREISRNLLDRNSTWTGPVIVKSDLNARGLPEAALARRIARREGHALASAPVPDYRVFDHISQVSDADWEDPALVIERYLPEKRDGLNVLRIWSFLGDYERCSWYASPEAVVKGANIRHFGTSEVPDALRQERARLGFDYGKFDFAIGPEGPVLFDTNRTPAYLHARPDLMHEGGRQMAAALIRLIRARRPVRGA